MNSIISKKAITLARVSTKEQEEEGYSVDAQTEYLEKYCKSKELEVVKRFKIAETASKPEMRKEFQLMLDYLHNHKIEHLVVEKVDRLTRNSKSAIVIDDWLDGNESRLLHLPKNGLVLHKNSTSQDRFMWDIYVAVAKQYANNLREEVKKGVLEKLRQGWYPATRPPIGYKHSGDKGHKIQIIDEEKAPLVKLAFELYDSGNYSILSLTNELKNQGLTSVVGKPLSKSYVHQMLRDKFYIGIMTWCGVEYSGSYEPLINEDLFEQVQIRLGNGTTPKVEKVLTLMHKKAKCGLCGGTVSWYRQKGHWYGECKSKKHLNTEGCARQDYIEEELAEYFNQLIAPSPAIIAWVKKELRQSQAQETEQYNASVKQLTKIALMAEYHQTYMT
jgi:site-specific DNA recombinase